MNAVGGHIFSAIHEHRTGHSVSEQLTRTNGRTRQTLQRALRQSRMNRLPKAATRCPLFTQITNYTEEILVLKLPHLAVKMQQKLLNSDAKFSAQVKVNAGFQPIQVGLKQ